MLMLLAKRWCKAVLKARIVGQCHNHSGLLMTNYQFRLFFSGPCKSSISGETRRVTCYRPTNHEDLQGSIGTQWDGGNSSLRLKTAQSFRQGLHSWTKLVVRSGLARKWQGVPRCWKDFKRETEAEFVYIMDCRVVPSHSTSACGIQAFLWAKLRLPNLTVLLGWLPKAEGV